MDAEVVCFAFAAAVVVDKLRDGVIPNQNKMGKKD